MFGDTTNTLGIGRGWPVITADGKRVGDVIEVHPHYLLVSRGVVLVRDMYLPLGAVDRTEDNKVILSVTSATLRGMNLSRVPPPPEPVEEPPPLHDPAPAGYSAAGTNESTYDAGAPAPDATVESYAETWNTTESAETYEYDELPSYTRPQLNGLVEVEATVNLAFQDLGYGQPILLVQGWPFDSTVWEPLPALLARDYRVVSFDPRGVGDSDRPWDFYSLDTLGQDMHRLIVEQALHDVTIVGWSSAALVALHYAHEHRRRVARLVLLNPLIPSWLADEELMAQLQLKPELDAQTQALWNDDLLADRPAQHERLLDRLTHAPLSEPRRRWLWQRLMLGAPHAQAKTWEALGSDDPRAWLAEVQAPVTIISGEHDRLAPPAIGAHLATLLPRAQHLVVGDCGHASFLEQRTAVLQAIGELLESDQQEDQGSALADEEAPASMESQEQPTDEVDEANAPESDSAGAPGAPAEEHAPIA
ncbi:MAG TPA: alpha/beta fold hydrolase [Chloroflexota bacterium]|jgi:peroxiredoxin|nr:alpha/beta fold hydrolase [Chloroflexota bacterium]